MKLGNWEQKDQAIDGVADAVLVKTKRYEGPRQEKKVAERKVVGPCYRCKRVGHILKNCTVRLPQQKTAHKREDDNFRGRHRRIQEMMACTTPD